MTLEERVMRIEHALREVRNEVALMKHRLDTGGFAAFEDGTALYRYMSGIIAALKNLDTTDGE